MKRGKMQHTIWLTSVLLLLSVCGRSSDRMLDTHDKARNLNPNSQNQDSTAAVTRPLPLSTTQPTAFPVVFESTTGEPATIYYTTDGSEPDFFSNVVSTNKIIRNGDKPAPVYCKVSTALHEICITQDTNVKWFSVDANNNREQTKSEVFRVRNASRSLSIQNQSSSLTLGYDATYSPNPSPVTLSYKVLLKGRMKVCLGGPDGSIPGSPDANVQAASQQLDVLQVAELYNSTKDTDDVATLDDVTCGSGDFTDLVSVSMRESQEGVSFPSLEEVSLKSEDIGTSKSLQIPVRFLHNHANVGTYKNYIYLIYEVLGEDGNVKGLTAKELQVITDVFRPQVFATLDDSQTFGTYRYVYLYSDDSVNQIYYRVGGSGTPISKADNFYSPSNPILIDENKTIRFAAFDTAGNSSDMGQRDYTLNLEAPSVSLNRDSGGGTMVDAPDTVSGANVRYTTSQLAGSNGLVLEVSGNDEVDAHVYLRVGGGTIQDGLITERDGSAGSGVTDVDIYSYGSRRFNPFTDENCETRTCHILIPGGNPLRDFTLTLEHYTQLEYAAFSAYSDKNKSDLEVIVTPPSQGSNDTDDPGDSSNGAFAPGDVSWLDNKQKIEETVEIKVFKTNGNYSSDIFSGLYLRDKLFVDVKSIVSADDEDRVFYEAGDVAIDSDSGSNANENPTTLNSRLDFSSFPSGLVPDDKETLQITYKYIVPIRRSYYIYDDGTANTEIQSSYRSLVYQEVDQDITATLTKNNLKSLPARYTDWDDPNYKTIPLLNIDMNQVVNPASGPCSGQGYGMLHCTLEIIKAGAWSCNDGDARNFSGGGLNSGMRTVPESIPVGSIPNICPGETNLEKQRISMQYLLTMTPQNADVSGTPIEDMMAISDWIINNIGSNYSDRADMFASLMNIDRSDPFVATEVIKHSIFRNLLRTHPFINDNDGTIPFLLSDAVTDLGTFSERYTYNNTGLRNASDNQKNGKDVAVRDTGFAPNGTGWKGFLFADMPPTQVMWDAEEDGHDAFSMSLPSNVKGKVQGGLVFQVDTGSGESSTTRTVKNPLNVSHLRIFPDPGSVDGNGDGLRDCGTFSYYNGIGGCDSDAVSDPEDPKTGGANTVDQDGIGMVIKGLNADVAIDMPFAMAGIHNKNDINMGGHRNNGFGAMHPWGLGGVPTKNWNNSGSKYETMFDAPHHPTNAMGQGIGLTYNPDGFPSSCWDTCVNQAVSQNYTTPYRIEYIVHHAGWAQYHHVGYSYEEFQAVIDMGWFEIPITLAKITRENDSWTTIDMDAAWVMELIGFYIPDSSFFLFETIAVAAQKRMFDLAPHPNDGNQVEVRFYIPDVPIGLTEAQMKNGIMETFTSPDGLQDMKNLAGDLFAVQDNAPEIYIDRFDTADGEDCAGGPSSGSVTCQSEDHVLVFNSYTYEEKDNVLFNASYHNTSGPDQQCDDNTQLFCGQKNWDILGNGEYFWRKYTNGTLQEPMDSNGSGSGKDKLVILRNGKLQIFDDAADDYIDAEEWQSVVYYTVLQDNKNSSNKYIFRLEFTPPQGGSDIGFYWSRVGNYP
jgi:hypothetical protein